MLSLHGQVERSPEAAEDLVPALAFSAVGEGKVRLYIVDGEVRGGFPSDFTLEITSPPPAQALRDGLGLGYLVLVPREHPATIDAPLPSSSIECEDGDESGGETCVETEERCLDSGACLTRVRECTEEVCPVISEHGVSKGPGGSSTIQCSSTACYSSVTECYDDDTCYRRASRCDVGSEGVFTSFGSRGTRTRCELVSETGDLAAAPLDDIGLIATNLNVFFLEELVPGADAAGLELGYNLLAKRDQIDDADFVSYSECVFKVNRDAITEYNRAHGSQLSHGEAFSSDEQLAQLALEEWKSCKNPLEPLVIEEPKSFPLRLQLDKGLLPKLGQAF